MTNKRIHVSAIVLLIAAIIIDMNNNGLCPGHAPAPAAWVPSQRTLASARLAKIIGSFMVHGTAW